MSPEILTAFFVGLFGSFHCIGMCGPLMITFTDQSGVKAYLSFITYEDDIVMLSKIVSGSIYYIGLCLTDCH